MEFTGERFVPLCQGEISAEHYHRYYFAARLVSGKQVLDIASGEGYGSHILAHSAAHVTGVDIAAEAVANATEKYARENLSFLQGSAAEIPLPDNCVDVVVSFETLEHLHEQEEMLQEIRRVLRDDGLLIMSTPNKPLFKTRGDDQFHVKELEQNEFTALLEKQFAHVTLLGQRVLYGSLLGSGNGDVLLFRINERAEEPECLRFLEQSMYFIALASNAPLPEVHTSFLDYPQEKSDIALRLGYELFCAKEQCQATKAALQATEECLKETEKQRAAMEKAFSEVINSKSWKITAPLRYLVSALRKGK